MSDLKHCPRCDDDWPADTDFFFADANSKDGLFYCCKACHTALRNSRRDRVGPEQPARMTDALARLGWPQAGAL